MKYAIVGWPKTPTDKNVIIGIMCNGLIFAKFPTGEIQQHF